MFDEQNAIIEKRLSDNWIETPIAFDNVNYKPTIGTPWVRLTVTWNGSSLISGTADAGLYREQGFIIIEVYTPINKGTQDNTSMCSEIAKLFRGYQSGSLYCQPPHVIRVGEEREWFHQNVYVPFYFDNCVVQPA